MARTVPPARSCAHRAARRIAGAEPHRLGWGLPYRRMRGAVRIFAMWSRGSSAGGRLDPGAVARALQETFAPLFSEPLRVTVHASEAAALVFLERPVTGWSAPFVQRGAGGVAFAVDYPVGVPRVLAACGYG